MKLAISSMLRFDWVEVVISVPMAWAAREAASSFITWARPWLPMGGMKMGMESLAPRMVVDRSTLLTPDTDCGSMRTS